MSDYVNEVVMTDINYSYDNHKDDKAHRIFKDAYKAWDEADRVYKNAYEDFKVEYESYRNSCKGEYGEYRKGDKEADVRKFRDAYESYNEAARVWDNAAKAYREAEEAYEDAIRLKNLQNMKIPQVSSGCYYD